MFDSAPIPTDQRFKNLTGKVFGRLTVDSYAGQWHGRVAHWNCVCACGNTVTVQGSKLSGGQIASCGCLKLELQTKHGHAATGIKSAEYSIWTGMKGRCTNPKTAEYHRYGARGVTVCERWMNSFAAFLEDMGPRPSPGHSIDRFPNNDGNYEPGNCRWATATQQQRNRRDSHLVTSGGHTLPIADWAEITGIPAHTLRYRLKHYSPEEAFAMPYKKRRQPA